MVQHDRAEYDLGVDLGTTATVAAVREAGASAARVVPLDGRSGPAGGRPRSTEGPAAQTVRQVTDRVARERGRAPRRVAVTHPAGWTSARRAAFAESLAEVGLLGVVLLPEPEAAAGAHAAAGRIPAGRAAAVYGLGAGAAGTCVVRGSDTGRVIALGRGATLATADVDGLGEKDLTAALTPSVALVRETLEAAQVPPEELDAVLLAGTSSRLPAVTRLLADAFGRPVVADADPATLVARGAALAAGGSTPPGASGSAPPSPARPIPAAASRTPSRTPVRTPIAAPTSTTAKPTSTPTSGPVATPTSGPTPVPARAAVGEPDDAVTDTVAASPSPAATDADDEAVTDTVAASPSPAATDADDEAATDTVTASPSSPTSSASRSASRSTPAAGSGTTSRTASRPGPQTRQSRVSRPEPPKRRGVLVGALGGGALLVAGGVLAATGGFGGASPAEAARPAGSAASAPLPAVPAAGPPRSAAPDAEVTRREEIRRETERSTARSARPATGTARPATPREPARATPARPAPTTRAAAPTVAPRATTEASRAPRATATTTPPPPGR